MKTRILTSLLAIACIAALVSCKHKMKPDTPLECNVNAAEVLGGEYSAADLRFFEVINENSEEGIKYQAWFNSLPDKPEGMNRLAVPASDTATFSPQIRELCLQLCNDANEYDFAWQPSVYWDDTIYELLIYNRTPLQVSGNDVVEASAVKSAYNGEPVLNFTFSEKAIPVWKQLTDEQIGNRIAIMLGKCVLSSPMILSVIENGQCSVSGLSEERTCALAKVLNRNAPAQPEK
ncbi:MAG: hypothetical protein IJL38_01145 [Bacteroidales bacterium]|nr:hypothetical protein [Bacteroidales bacterium]